MAASLGGRITKRVAPRRSICSPSRKLHDGGRGGFLGGSFNEADDDVVGVTVEVAAGPVIPCRHPRVAVSGGDLHIPQRNAGVQAGGDESVT